MLELIENVKDKITDNEYKLLLECLKNLRTTKNCENDVDEIFTIVNAISLYLDALEADSDPFDDDVVISVINRLMEKTSSLHRLLKDTLGNH
jgi:hypothetical protein